MSLNIEKLFKHYSQGDERIEILKGAQATIQDGEVVAIVGQSGSGKSTLLSLLAGLDVPSQGRIEIGGKNIAEMSENQLTDFRGKNIGIVFQQFHLINHLTALENVMIPLEILAQPQAQERAQKVLIDVGLGHRLNHLPSQLSGGECQRVAIARALVADPKILLADEPSGNLDSATGEKVMDLLLEVARKKKVTTILVTHALELAQRCDRKLTLKNGELWS
jgi:putative ABC transport system ATP-binding protein